MCDFESFEKLNAGKTPLGIMKDDIFISLPFDSWENNIGGDGLYLVIGSGSGIVAYLNHKMCQDQYTIIWSN